MSCGAGVAEPPSARAVNSAMVERCSDDVEHVEHVAKERPQGCRSAVVAGRHASTGRDMHAPTPVQDGRRR